LEKDGEAEFLPDDAPPVLGEPVKIRPIDAGETGSG